MCVLQVKNIGINLKAELTVDCVSNKIQKVAKHLQQHKKDLHSKVGLLCLVNLRKKLQKYLNKKNKKRI